MLYEKNNTLDSSPKDNQAPDFKALKLPRKTLATAKFSFIRQYKKSIDAKHQRASKQQVQMN
jgi:hypothetical protein